MPGLTGEYDINQQGWDRRMESIPAAPYDGIRTMALKKVTGILIICMAASFIIRAAGTLFPSVFQNPCMAKGAITFHTFFMIIHFLFFVCFVKEFAAGRSQSLKATALLAMAGSLSLLFIYFKNFCLVFEWDILPPSLIGHPVEAVVPFTASLFQLVFFIFFRKVLSRDETKVLRRAVSAAIIGVALFMSLHLLGLAHFLTAQKSSWLEHMPRIISLGTLPLIVLAVILILYFYWIFYRFLEPEKR